ncbi:CipC protein [Gloeopeniophorella convolvens]|nr:CipC protein [Gloeopeniophorella convolvens]
MGWFGDDSNEASDYNTYQTTPKHESKVSHEMISGAAAYEAAKAYEDHVARNGQPDSHAKAKELLAGFAGAFIDKEFESNGLDFLDKEKAKYQARQRAEQAVSSDNY